MPIRKSKFKKSCRFNSLKDKCTFSLTVDSRCFNKSDMKAEERLCGKKKGAAGRGWGVTEGNRKNMTDVCHTGV